MRYTFSGILLIVFINGLSQNLVPNPGFEEVVRCPSIATTTANDFIVPGWVSPTQGTPDHFHACGTGEADVPLNWAGNSNAHSGKGYVGVYVWNTRDNYREYIQCELAEQLNAGEKYLLEFHYKLAGNAVYAVDRFAMTLSETPVHVQHDQVLKIDPVFSIEHDSSMVKTTVNWMHVRQEYVAKGGERYVILGNFSDKDLTKAQRLPFRYGQSTMLNFNSYYFVDDVSVKSIDHAHVNRDVTPVLLNVQAIELNRDYILKDMKFEFETYAIHPAANDELNKIVAYLKEHAHVRCHLYGHVDFIGTEEDNLLLSRNRARSVADFLIKKGIEPHRVVSYGFGNSRPISAGKKEDDRKINRRVEIRFIGD